MAWQDQLEKAIVSLLDNGSKLQAPAVATYVDRTRRAHPEETPAQTIARLETLYLNAVTGSGGAVGATAAIPGVGTVAALTAAASETLFFLEASALFTLAVAAIHGIAPQDHEQRRALVLAVVLGDSGREVVERMVGRSANNWAELLAGRTAATSTLSQSLLRRFVMCFAVRRGALLVGKVIPAGIGAVIGSVGNRTLGRQVTNNARAAFGPPPPYWTGVIVPGEN
jgi:hypothetical protein